MDKATRETKSEMEGRPCSPFGTRMAKVGPETDAGGSNPGSGSSFGRDRNPGFGSVQFGSSQHENTTENKYRKKRTD